MAQGTLTKANTNNSIRSSDRSAAHDNPSARDDVSNPRSSRAERAFARLRFPGPASRSSARRMIVASRASVRPAPKRTPEAPLVAFGDPCGEPALSRIWALPLQQGERRPSRSAPRSSSLYCTMVSATPWCHSAEGRRRNPAEPGQQPKSIRKHSRVSRAAPRADAGRSPADGSCRRGAPTPPYTDTNVSAISPSSDSRAVSLRETFRRQAARLIRERPRLG